MIRGRNTNVGPETAPGRLLDHCGPQHLLPAIEEGLHILVRLETALEARDDPGHGQRRRARLAGQPPAVVQQVLDVEQHFLEPVEPHHALIRRRPVGVQIDADHVGAAREQPVECRLIREQLGAKMDAAHARSLRQAHEVVERIVQ